MRKNDLRLLKGTLDLMVLKALAGGPMHGFEITTWLEHWSGGDLAIPENALYQALQRLGQRRLVGAEWGVTENNRRARYYSLTPAGERQLRAEAERWRRYVHSLDRILAATH